MKRLFKDFVHLAVLLIGGTALIFFSVQLAQLVHEPAFAPWGLFAGLAVYGAALSHALRRLMFPHVDLNQVATEAKKSPTGAGLVFLGVCVVLTAFLGMMGNLVHAAELPPNAVKYIPVLKAEKTQWWAAMPAPATLAAQIEQETCVSLNSPRCWSPLAELRTSRERGVGLGQITKTGRFDALAEIRQAYPTALAGWSWESHLYDPSYQLRALVLKDYRGWRNTQGASTDADRLAFTYAAYNGGIGGVLSDRRVCAARLGCDPGRWFGNVEHASLKQQVAANGYGKSFFAINREYVLNITQIRRAKYDEVMQ